MALQIRRGLEAGRAAVTPAPGELLFTTDQTKLYIGDGATAGGTLVTGSGIGNLVEDTTPQLGGNLDVNSFSIVSTSNGNINITPNGSGNVVLHGDLVIDSNGNITKTGQLNISTTTFTSFGSNSTLVDGNVYITRNSYSTVATEGFIFAQHHNTADAVNFSFYRTRGTGTVPTVVLNGDDLADITFSGYDGSARATAANIGAIVEGAPTTGHVPAKLTFSTNNGSGNNIRAELSSDGTWKTNTITALTTNLNLAIAANGTGSVQVDGTLFKSTTMTMAPLNAQPVGAAGKMAVCDGTTWNGGGDGLQHLMIYINNAWTVVV